MNNQDQDYRLIQKQDNGVPTIPVSADHRNGDWINTDIYEGELYQDLDTGLMYTRKGSTIVTVTGERVYSALLTQSGTSAPVATYTYKNTFAGTITFSRTAVGTYNLISSVAEFLDFSKMEVMTGGGIGFVVCTPLSETRLKIEVYDETVTKADDYLGCTIIFKNY